MIEHKSVTDGVSEGFERWATANKLDLSLDLAGYYADITTYMAWKAFEQATRWVRSGPTKKCYRNAEILTDCDAPFCGCNPAWSEAIEMLQEIGWSGPDD